MSLKDQILSSDDMAKEQVECPEWGVTLTVRELRTNERMKLVKMHETGDEMVTATACAMTIVNEAGEREFSDADIEALSQKSSRVLERISEAVLRISGLTQASMEEAEKN